VLNMLADEHHPRETIGLNRPYRQVSDGSIGLQAPRPRRDGLAYWLGKGIGPASVGSRRNRRSFGLLARSKRTVLTCGGRVQAVIATAGPFSQLGCAIPVFVLVFG
jgi:hypothetical protein